MLKPVRYIDEIEASSDGYQWLKSFGMEHGAERMENFSGQGSGCCASVWKGNQLLGYFVVIRDIFNWSVVIKHDLTIFNHEPFEDVSKHH